MFINFVICLYFILRSAENSACADVYFAVVEVADDNLALSGAGVYVLAVSDIDTDMVYIALARA